MKRYWITWLCATSAWGQYAPLELPAKWTFTEPTPAYALDAPATVQGNFQRGITVEVDGIDADTGLWRVIFKRYGSPDITSLIDVPNLAHRNSENFSKVATSIEGFPLLQKMLEAEEPWPQSPQALGERLFANAGSSADDSIHTINPQQLRATQPEQVATAWGMQPLSAQLDYTRADSPTLNIELWNKGDAFKSRLNPSSAHRTIEAELNHIQEYFRTHLKDPAAELSSGITAVKVKEKVYLLPNDLRVALRYDRDEYLTLSIQSIAALQAFKPPVYDPATFHQRLLSKVDTSSDGHRYIKDIPMIDQGEKGYCAAATLARVMQFYGYTVDQHAMADLAETEAQQSSAARGGTLRKDILKAMARICGSTPFRLREVAKAHPHEISEKIEKGIPIVWIIPGHMRLLIGIHPEKNEIVYSDSWGPEHSYKTASWDYFINANQEMWVLEPR